MSININHYSDPKEEDQVDKRTIISWTWWIVRCLADPKEISITIPRIPHFKSGRYQLRCWRGHKHAAMYKGHVDRSNSRAQFLFEVYTSEKLSENFNKIIEQLKEIGIETDGWEVNRATMNNCTILTFKEKSSLLYLEEGPFLCDAPDKVVKIIMNAIREWDKDKGPVMKYLRAKGLPKNYYMPEKLTRELSIKDFDEILNTWPIIGPINGYREKEGVVAFLRATRKKSEWE
ncbi:MAG: hypothetical protein PHF35_03155 [Candidatus Moranbacteria bacterium]|nr:hypothetical protein [Candidatus Moranbacteria bacterium]